MTLIEAISIVEDSGFKLDDSSIFDKTLIEIRLIIHLKLEKVFPKIVITTKIIKETNLVIFYIETEDKKLELWCNKKNKEYSIIGISNKITHTKDFDEIVDLLKISLKSESSESEINIEKIKTILNQKNFKYFGFRGDGIKVSVGQILRPSYNGLRGMSIAGDNEYLSGTSTMGIPEPFDDKNIILAWRGFRGLTYGKYFSLVGGRSMEYGDDTTDVYYKGKTYEIEEYIIKDAKVLYLLN
jgi:hypothetical protein